MPTPEPPYTPALPQEALLAEFARVWLVRTYSAQARAHPNLFPPLGAVSVALCLIRTARSKGYGRSSARWNDWGPQSCGTPVRRGCSAVRIGILGMGSGFGQGVCSVARAVCAASARHCCFYPWLYHSPWGCLILRFHSDTRDRAWVRFVNWASVYRWRP